MQVKLNDVELAVANLVALGRRAASRGHNVVDRQKGGQDPMEIEVNGVLGEIAFAKAYGYYWMDNPRPQSDTPDFVSRKNKTIDIKATSLKTGRLLKTVESKVHDIYVLAVVDGRTVDLVGWVPGEELASSIADLGHGPTNALTQDKLRPMPQTL